MIKEDTKTMINARVAEICKLHGVTDVPKVEEYGPFSGQFVCPSTWTDDQTVDIMTEFANVDWVFEQEGAFLGMYYDAQGEEFTEEEARTFVFDIDKNLCTFSGPEMKQHRAENVIELRPEWENAPDNVYLPLRNCFFDAIQNGTKTVECREYKECWVKRLLGPRAKYVTFQRGYAKNAEKMVFRVDHYELEDEDKRRYSPWDIPPMGTPAMILIHLGNRVL